MLQKLKIDLALTVNDCCTFGPHPSGILQSSGQTRLDSTLGPDEHQRGITLKSSVFLSEGWETGKMSRSDRWDSLHSHLWYFGDTNGNNTAVPIFLVM